MQCFTYDSLNRLTKGTTSNDSAKGCNTQLGNGNYSEDYAYDSATGNLLSKTGIGTYAYSASHSHAVISTSANNWSFTYDSNGNMTQRNLNGTIYNYSYNAENKLTDVSGATTASFTYDGDGNRVKTVVGGTTTVFLGNYYEWTSSTVKKYYFAGTTRIAMRENSTLIFLSGDHLGSTSLVYKTDSGLVIKKLYKPWGETRYTSTTMPTRFQFTGQYREVSLGGADGLYYFVARWYDQALGRFLQADTIVPQPGDVQAWDRYAYVQNQPLKYIDPSGHCKGNPYDDLNPDIACWEYLNKIQGDFTNTSISTSFSLNELKRIYKALQYARNTLANGKQSKFAEIFIRLFILVSPVGGSFSYPPGSDTIYLSHKWLNQPNSRTSVHTILHELMHVFDVIGSNGDPHEYKSTKWLLKNGSYPFLSELGSLGDPLQAGDWLTKLLYGFLGGGVWNEYSPPGEKVPSPYAGFSSIDDFAESGANYIMLNNDIYYNLDTFRTIMFDTLVNQINP
jgi:RHS repeat-associated protein